MIGSGYSLVKWLSWMAVVAFLVIGAHWFYDPKVVLQPIEFNHARHRGMSCEICHSGVLSRARAGFPSLALCSNCHASPPVSTPAEKKWWNYFTAQKKIPWQSVYQVPPHAYFSHRRHLASRQFGCTSCHGNVQDTERPPQTALVAFSMNRCIKCHQFTSFSHSEHKNGAHKKSGSVHPPDNSTELHETMEDVELTCASCHKEKLASEQVPTKVISSVPRQKCVGCHPFQQVSTDCTACHH